MAQGLSRALQVGQLEGPLATMGKKGGIDRQLYDAVKREKVQEVERLLKEGANPNAPVGKKGMTPLARAQQKEKNTQITAALERGESTTNGSPSIPYVYTDGAS